MGCEVIDMNKIGKKRWGLLLKSNPIFRKFLIFSLILITAISLSSTLLASKKGLRSFRFKGSVSYSSDDHDVGDPPVSATKP